jgi:glycerophosphoryl diester phosphodiesterase
MASIMDLQIFGHRGYAARRIENTISAFELAAETEGITGVELDVQIARDGEVVVHHDRDLTRLADDSRRIVEVSSGELATTAIHATDRTGNELTTVGIPSLNTVIDTLPRWMRIDIELKSYDDTPRDLPERVARLLADRVSSHSVDSGDAHSDHAASGRFFVSSFDPRLVRRFRRAMRRLSGTHARPGAARLAGRFAPRGDAPCAGRIATAVIYSEDPEVPRFLRTGLGVRLTGSEIAKPSWQTVLSEARGGRPHRPAGWSRAPQYVWTVNDESVLRRLMVRNVAGVIGDDPGELVSWATAIVERSAERDGGRRPERRSE